MQVFGLSYNFDPLDTVDYKLHRLETEFFTKRICVLEGFFKSSFVTYFDFYSWEKYVDSKKKEMYFFLHKPVTKIVANFASDMAHSALRMEKKSYNHQFFVFAKIQKCLF